MGKSFYDLIAGERRWRAAQLARIHEIPCIIFNNVDANSASVMSLIENIQRKDLNPIEEAKGYSDLINQHNYTQEDAFKITRKSFKPSKGKQTISWACSFTNWKTGCL